MVILYTLHMCTKRVFNNCNGNSISETIQKRSIRVNYVDKQPNLRMVLDLAFFSK